MALTVSTGLQGSSKVLLCAGCGSGRTQPEVAAERLGDLYPEAYNAYAMPSNSLARLLATCLFEARYWLALRSDPFRRLGDLTPPGRLLDVGSGRGDLGVVLGRRGWDVVGLEPSEQACQVARRRGVKTQAFGHSPTRRTSRYQGGFDAVVFNHSLEHVIEPIEDAEAALSVTPYRWASDRLGPELRLVAAVGVLVGRWFHLDLPRHRSHFSPPGLTQLLARAGFAHVAVGTTASADGLPMSLQYRRFGRRRFDRGVGRYVAVAATLLFAPATAAVSRAAGDGDVLHAVAVETEGLQLGQRLVLMIAQLAAPSPLVAARRVAGLTKYLGRLGYHVTILTSAISGGGPVEGAAEVVRTADLMASSLNWRRRHFAALTGQATGDLRASESCRAGRSSDLALAGWLPFALPRALALSRGRRFDVVVTTSPPPSSHFVGRALRCRKTRWIAELRDGWTFEPPHAAWPLRLQRRADRSLEARFLKHADAVVGVTEPIVADLRHRLGVDARLITNGFDPDVPGGREGGDPLLDPKRHSIVHTGRMALARSSPRALLDGLRMLHRSQPAEAARIELVFAGPLSQEERDLMTAPDVTRQVRVTGAASSMGGRYGFSGKRTRSWSSPKARADKASQPGSCSSTSLPARPILVLGDETEAARIVRETRTGEAVSATDPNSIAEGLRQAALGESTAPDQEAIARYSWEHLAGMYAELIEEICRG